MNKQGPDALKKAVERMLSEANTRMQAGKTLDAARSYKKAAQFAEQSIELLSDADERRAMTLRATEYKQRSRSLETTGRADLGRVKPSEMPADEIVYSDEDSDLQEQQILLLIDDTPRTIEWESIGGLLELKEELKFHFGLAIA